MVGITTSPISIGEDRRGCCVQRTAEESLTTYNHVIRNRKMKRIKKNDKKLLTKCGSEDHEQLIMKYTQTDAYKYLKELQKNNKIKKINILQEENSTNVQKEGQNIQSSNLKIEHMPHVNVNPKLTKQLAFKIQINKSEKLETKNNCALFTFTHEASNLNPTFPEQSKTEIQKGTNLSKREKSLDHRKAGVSKLRNFLFQNCNDDRGENYLKSKLKREEQKIILKSCEVQTEFPEISTRLCELKLASNKENGNGELPPIDQKDIEEKNENSKVLMEKSVGTCLIQRKGKELSTITEENDFSSSSSTLEDVTELNKDDTRSSNSILEEINEIQGLISEIEAIEREEVKMMSDKDHGYNKTNNEKSEIEMKKIIMEKDKKNKINEIADKINTNKELIILMNKDYDNQVMGNLRKIYSEMIIKNSINDNKDKEVKWNNLENQENGHFVHKNVEYINFMKNEESQVHEELSEGEIYVPSLGEVTFSSLEIDQITASKSDENS